MLDLETPELIPIFATILLVFGAGRIGKVADERSGSVCAFREGIKKSEDADT